MRELYQYDLIQKMLGSNGFKLERANRAAFLKSGYFTRDEFEIIESHFIKGAAFSSNAGIYLSHNAVTGFVYKFQSYVKHRNAFGGLSDEQQTTFFTNQMLPIGIKTTFWHYHTIMGEPTHQYTLDFVDGSILKYSDFKGNEFEKRWGVSFPFQNPKELLSYAIRL